MAHTNYRATHLERSHIWEKLTNCCELRIAWVVPYLPTYLPPLSRMDDAPHTEVERPEVVQQRLVRLVLPGEHQHGALGRQQHRGVATAGQWGRLAAGRHQPPLLRRCGAKTARESTHSGVRNRGGRVLSILHTSTLNYNHKIKLTKIKIKFYKLIYKQCGKIHKI